MSCEPFPEVYRDATLLVIDKPAGVPSQRTASGEPGVYELLAAREAYVALHHRLDRRASGLLLLALDRRVNRRLASAFRQHTIRRIYVARCEGEVLPGSWNWPIGDKPARTEVEPLSVNPDGTTDVRCTLETGRTHQIRIHAAMNGTPLVGDRRYGGDLARPWHRLALHATTLRFTHPLCGTPLTLESPVPWRRM